MSADRLRLAMMLSFSIHALIMGGLFSRIAEVQRDLRLGAEEFGLAMSGMAVGVLIGLPVSASLVHALGTRRLTMLMMAVAAFSVPAVGLAPGFWSLFLALVVLGLTTAMANQAMNIEADRLALATGRPLLALCHAAWGVGFLVYSTLGTLAIRIGITPQAQFDIIALLVLAGVALIVAPIRESPPRPQTGAQVARFALPDRGNLQILAYACFGLCCEILLRTWSVIYLRDQFGAADWVAALSLPLFVVTQTIGRYALAPLAARMGVALVANGMTLLAVAGLAMVALAPSTPVAMVGCALAGLGTAGAYPLSFSALARATNRSAGENMAGFSILQNLLMMVAPPLFGLAAEAFGMRVALGLIVPMALLAWLQVRHVSNGPMT